MTTRAYANRLARDALKRRPALRRRLESRLAGANVTGSAASRIRARLFPEQLAFVDSAAKRKAALCSRRAGKTYGIAAWLYLGALAKPGKMSVYICESLPQGYRNIMPAMNALNRLCGLGMRERTIKGQVICELPNGHQIWIAGCSDRSECDKFRGAGDGYSRVVIDEAGSGAIPGFLPYLVQEVLTAALLDQRGELALTGTPGVVCAGLFYTATTGDGAPKWETHEWTLLRNPHIPDAAEFLEETKRENGWDDKTPLFVREYLGRWVRDNSILALPYDHMRNAVAELPDFGDRPWDYVLAADVGATGAPSAFVVLGTPRGLPDLYVLKAYARHGLSPSSFAAEIKKLQAERRMMTTIIDTGGLGAGYALEMVERHHIACEAAKKTEKRMVIEVTRGELMSGNMKLLARECRDLIDEISALPLNEDDTNFDADHFPCHCSDALVYAVRKCRPLYNEKEERRAETPEEFQARRMKEHREKTIKQAQANAKKRSKLYGRLG